MTMLMNILESRRNIMILQTLRPKFYDLLILDHYNHHRCAIVKKRGAGKD